MTRRKKAAEIQEGRIQYKCEDQKKQQQSADRVARSIQGGCRSGHQNTKGIPNVKPKLYSVGALNALTVVNYPRAAHAACTMKGDKPRPRRHRPRPASRRPPLDAPHARARGQRRQGRGERATLMTRSPGARPPPPPPPS